MTLIIAGHNSKNKQKDGIFIAADSVITAPGKDCDQPLVGGFEKVYKIPLNVWKPDFIGRSFHSYRSVYFQSSFFMAFAGSTLTAQHVLNTVTAHLSKLRISYGDLDVLDNYCIIRHCQDNIFYSGNAIEWDEDMFLENDYPRLLDSDIFISVIEHSINVALSSARKYKLSHDQIESLQTQYIVGLYCPLRCSYRLFEFTVEAAENSDGVYVPSLSKNEVLPGHLAIIGKRDTYKNSANNCYKKTDHNTDAGLVMYAYLNKVIDDDATGEIDKPSFLKSFYNGELTNIKTTKNDFL